jgi:CheY-like chemotaxis protein
VSRRKRTIAAAKGGRRKQKVVRPRRARQRPRALDVALAGLAHEVRTPLNGILALGELLAASDLPERERGWAAAVKSAAEHIAQLTTVVVDGVKADAGKLVLRQDAFRPRILAEAVAATLRARADTKGLVAAVEIADDLPLVAVGDPVRLRAAIENLIDNAVKFTEQGRVSLAVGAKPAGKGRSRLTFVVEDTGIGISAAEIKRLFRPFSQASKEVARRFAGTGLGLAFVKSIARGMKGNLTTSSRPGRGSRFSLDVVVATGSAHARDGVGQPVPLPVTPARRLRILCAEDNPYGRVVLNTILTELGHQPDFVGTGEAAVEAAGRGGHDVVLMDVTLPDLDGIAATRLIRGLSVTGARVPIIGISGRSGASEQAAARAAGMNAYLAKPVSPAAIASLLNELVRD